MKTFRPLSRHPSREDLVDWLVGDGTPSLDDHLATCQRCATEIEQLDALNSPADLGVDATLATALTDALSPPADFSQRLEQKVSDKLNSYQLFDLATDLIGAGFETTLLLFTEEPPDDDL